MRPGPPAAECFARNTLRKSAQTRRTYLDAVAGYLGGARGARALEGDGAQGARRAEPSCAPSAADRRDLAARRAGDPRRRGLDDVRPSAAAPGARRGRVATREGSRGRARARALGQRARVELRRRSEKHDHTRSMLPGKPRARIVDVRHDRGSARDAQPRATRCISLISQRGRGARARAGRSARACA